MSRQTTPLIPHDDIIRAQECLNAGGLVALPTETVYGLAADAMNDTAVAKIFAVKGRPHFNPLLAHFASLSDVVAQVDLSPKAMLAAQKFWPGPLTIVAPIKRDCSVSSLARDGASTLAVRVPRLITPVDKLLAAFPGGLVAPSANPSGKLSPTTAGHVMSSLGAHIDIVLDGGPCPVGVESTILDCSIEPPCILRHGGLAKETLAEILGFLSDSLTPERIKAPGQLASHYAPNAQIETDVSWTAKTDAEVAWLGFHNSQGDLNLSASGDLVEAAANLFAMLAELDTRPGVKKICVAPIPSHGLGRAINDRLARASANR